MYGCWLLAFTPLIVVLVHGALPRAAAPDVRDPSGADAHFAHDLGLEAQQGIVMELIA